MLCEEAAIYPSPTGPTTGSERAAVAPAPVTPSSEESQSDGADCAGEMSVFELIKAYFAYSSWATARLFDALEQLTAEQYDERGASGHGSIRDNLAHLMAVQLRWFSWFDGSLTGTLAQLLNVTRESMDIVAKSRQRWRCIDAQAADDVHRVN